MSAPAWPPVRVETDDRRVLGAVRFVDATTRLAVTTPIVVRAAGVRWQRGRGGDHVVFAAPGLDAHADAFGGPPGTPAPGSVAVELTITDPSGRYLARRRTIRLPLDPAAPAEGAAPPPLADFDPASADDVGSLFHPVTVVLFPAPAASTAPGWAVVRGTTRPGALVRVVRASDGAHLTSGLADDRGEVLVAVAGIPVTTWSHNGGGPVVATGVDVRLEVIHDPAAPSPPDPLDLERRRDSLRVSTTSATLTSGQEVVRTL